MNQYGKPIILFDPSMIKDRIKDREAYKVNIKKNNFKSFFSQSF
jgi:hypothetical protein